LNYAENLEVLGCGDIGNYITRFEDNKIYSSFYLKENINNLKYILDKSKVEMKASQMSFGGQSSILLLFRFAESNKFIYGRIYNLEIDFHREHMEMLMFQEELPICFVDSNNIIISTTLVKNDFKNDIKKYIIKRKFKYKPSYDFKDDGCKIEDLWMYI
jgi:hypothetical protein